MTRERLNRSLDCGVQASAVLVCAGAGSGKSVAVRAWAAATSQPVAWLSLGPGDNEPGRFAARLLAVCRRAAGLAMDDQYRAPPEAIELAVARATAGLAERLILVLDGLEEIHEPAVQKQITALLLARDELAVVLLSRSEPELPLHRLRVAGELTEIRSPDLRFTPAETVELLAGYGVVLAPEQLADLHRRSAGWAAGLSLFAAALSAKAPEYRTDACTGESPAIAAYLSCEVLARLPAATVEFMRLTSLPDELSGALADALTGRDDSERLLEELVRANAFVVPGSLPGRYRYHPLLHDLLRQQLRREHPTAIAGLHRRAARLQSNRNVTLAALRSAAGGEDWAFVAHLVATRGGPLLLASDRGALAAVLERIPAAAFGTSAEFRLCAALLMLCAGDYEAVLTHIAGARQLLPRTPTQDRQMVEVTLSALELVAARARGDIGEQLAAAAAILEAPADAPVDQLPARLQYRAIALSGGGAGLLWAGRLDEGEQMLWAAVVAARAAGVPAVEVSAVGHLALLAFLRGSLTDARQHALAGRMLAQQNGLSELPPALPADLALALVSLERHDLGAAQQALARAHAAHRTDRDVSYAVLLDLVEATVARRTGALGAARAAIGRTRGPIDRLSAAPLLVRWAALAESELDLADGRPERVRERYHARPEGEAMIRREAVCLAQAELTLGAFARAEALLHQFGATPADLLATVESWIRDTLMAAARRGNTWPVDDEAPLRSGELEPARPPAAGPASTPDRQRWLVEGTARLIADLLTEKAPAAGTRDAGAGASIDTSDPLVGELSEREREVLQYLPTMLNGQDIADELHVSLNTVKAHLKAIYRKLGATRRREAVLRARRLGILEGLNEP